jgi:putative FmdB family regulatory protein
MPLYEYRCSKCGSVFEVLQKFSDAPLTSHEGCGGEVERLLSAPGLQFKGSGWYVTDYAKGSGGKSDSTKESSATEASATEKKDKASESKPAADSSKAESKPSTGKGAEKA